jgi:hypothetical protein
MPDLPHYSSKATEASARKSNDANDCNEWLATPATTKKLSNRTAKQ